MTNVGNKDITSAFSRSFSFSCRSKSIHLKQSSFRSRDLVKLGTGGKTTREQAPDWTSTKKITGHVLLILEMTTRTLNSLF